MFSVRDKGLVRVQQIAQRVAQALVILVAVALVAATAMAALGWTGWPDLALSFGGQPLPDAGMWAQIALTLLAVALCAFLPANARMARLEAGHRSFAMGVEDVARAYRMAHAADRASVFALSGEFDSVRARMEHLRRHPDFGHLEPELLELAAQMSHETRALAQTYSDVRVARARAFLQQRQEEVQALTDRLAIARATCDELRRWLTDIDSEERQAQVQLKRLEADLKEILPGLGYAVDFEDRLDGNVVTLPKPAARVEVARPESARPEISRPDRPEPRG